MSLKIDRVQLEIVINNDQARKNLRLLAEEEKKVTKELKHLQEGTVEYTQKAARLKTIKQQMDSIYESIGITNMTMRELQRRQKELNAILVNMRPGTKEYQDLKHEVTQVSNRIVELKGKASQVNSALGNSSGIVGKLRAGYIAAAAGAYTFIAGIRSVVTSYAEEEKALKKVEQAIKSTNGAAGLSLRELKQTASDLQSSTIFGDETILNSVTAQLLTFTNVTGDTFKRAQVAAMDLATVLDGDLQSSSIMLGKALNDPISGLTALRRVGVAFTTDQRETIKELASTNRLVEAQAIILNELNKQYGGQAEAAAKGTGAITQFQNKFSDLQETIGKSIVQVFYPFVNVLGNITDSINNWISKPLSAELENERSKVNALTSALMDGNISQAERQQYYNELKKLAPEVIENIDVENVSIAALTRNLATYNEQMLNKILLQRKEEEITKLLDKQADAFERVTEATTDLMKSADKVYGSIVVEGGKASQSAINLKAMYMAGRIGADEYARSLFNLSEREKIATGQASAGAIALMNLEKAQREYQSATQQSISLEKERNDFMKNNGMLKADELKLSEQTNDMNDENNDNLTKTVTLYEKMSSQITDAKDKLKELVLTGNLDDAMKLQQTIDHLERTKQYLDEIIAAGGDLDKVISRTQVSSINQLTSLSPDNAFDAGTMVTRNSGTEVAIGENPNIFEGMDKSWYLEQAKVASDAVFDIWNNSIEARYDREIDMMNRQMDIELSNKNLTEEQKDAIRAKYAEREAKLKQEQFRKQKTADIIQATINTALAITRALPSIPLAIAAGIMGAAQIAVIAAQQVPQYAAGKYDVIGAEDGKRYTATYSGSPQTRIYTKPTLIAEQGGELVVDAATTRNLQMNYPGIIESIMAARVPQMASGNVPAMDPAMFQNPELLEAITKLNANLEKGVRGKWYLYDLGEAQDKLSNIESNSTF